MNNSKLTDVTGGYGDKTLTFTRLKSDGNAQLASHHHLSLAASNALMQLGNHESSLQYIMNMLPTPFT